MTNNEAIKALDIENVNLSGNTVKISEFLKALDYAIEVLQNDRWIPASEKMPDSSDEVLIQVSGDYLGYHVEDELMIGSADGVYWIIADLEGWENLRVKAWRKLPKKYISDSDEI